MLCSLFIGAVFPLYRSVYTKRIIDISAKVRKQKQEIDRVLADTRTIQKEINILSGKLERTFTVVEGTAYKEAANNERVRQVYRAVAAVHEGCGELVDIVRETGATQRKYPTSGNSNCYWCKMTLVLHSDIIKMFPSYQYAHLGILNHGQFMTGNDRATLTMYEGHEEVGTGKSGLVKGTDVL
ncbi:Coiled-coil domain-containing protein 22 [Chionoecetes opilio]|uniref:Coiled-coil domain-containing protein 22 homolog n=1 Tax=Chionoecetes opilio TaxID=41210 RepID=A0A8J4XQ05_CHIOP|nr:Coiled-coil domain-containing protein 22 [Chionoecetes opilio]